MGMILKNVTNDVYTFENEYGKTFEFTWEEVRSIATALMIEYLKQDVSDTVDNLIDDEEINPAKLNGLTVDQFKEKVVDELSYGTIQELAEPDMDLIWNKCYDMSKDLYREQSKKGE